jgi:hypothetical protein
MGSAPEDGELRSARPRARTRAQPRKTTNSASPDPRARTQAPPRRTMNSASPDPRARAQPWPQPTVSASSDPGARTRPRSRPRRSLHLAQPRARTDRVNRKRHDYPTPSWLRLRGTRPASHQARSTILVMMAPRMPCDDGGS